MSGKSCHHLSTFGFRLIGRNTNLYFEICIRNILIWLKMITYLIITIESCIVCHIEILNILIFLARTFSSHVLDLLTVRVKQLNYCYTPPKRNIFKYKIAHQQFSEALWSCLQYFVRKVYMSCSNTMNGAFPRMENNESDNAKLHILCVGVILAQIKSRDFLVKGRGKNSRSHAKNAFKLRK